MHRTKVLLCDDALPIRLLLRTEFGFEPELEVVAEAGNGRQAVALAQEHQPDVIVIDVDMPIMNGLEALELLREASPDSKVVVLSDFDPADMAEVVATLGAAIYLQKDTSLESIAEHIKECARLPE